jgi:DNA replication protein DnaC
VELQESTIKAHCKALRMPMIALQFSTLAEQAIREKQSHMGYLEALLLAEVEERERNTVERRIREAHLPRNTPSMGQNNSSNSFRRSEN